MQVKVLTPKRQVSFKISNVTRRGSKCQTTAEAEGRDGKWRQILSFLSRASLDAGLQFRTRNGHGGCRLS